MALRDVIEEVQSYIRDGHSARANEQETKEWFISPILRELGWVGPNRLASESRPGQERTRMDYSLLGPQRKPLALIEAKASRRGLADNDVTQMLNYDFHQAGVDICVLTNGIAWWLYLPREKGNPAERRFTALNLSSDDVTDLTEQLESCLQYEALTSGESKKRAKTMLDALQLERQLRNEIPLAWQRLLSGPNEMLVELVQEEVEDAVGSRPGYELVKNELSSFVRHPRASASEILRRDKPEPETLPVEPSSETIAQAPQAKSGPVRQPTGIRLRGKHRPVARTWNDALYQLAVLMWEQHDTDFDRVMRWGGPNRPYVILDKNEVPPTRRPKRIADSPYFLDMNWSSSAVQERAHELLVLFGYVPTDFEFEFD